jgi:hypothetical protein
MKSFWVEYGRDVARTMAEDRRAEVVLFYVFFVFLFLAMPSIIL